MIEVGTKVKIVVPVDQVEELSRESYEALKKSLTNLIQEI